MAWRRRWRSCARPNRSAGTRVVTEEMTRYYARRAAEDERVYEIPTCQPALAELRRRVAAFFTSRGGGLAACRSGEEQSHRPPPPRGRAMAQSVCFILRATH